MSYREQRLLLLTLGRNSVVTLLPVIQIGDVALRCGCLALSEGSLLVMIGVEPSGYMKEPVLSLLP